MQKMTQPIPQTKASQLFDKAIALGKQKNPSEFTIHSLKRDLLHELKHEPVVSHIALGVLAAMEWNIKDLHKHHNCSISLKDCAWTRDNYAISLAHVGLYHDAAEQVILASEMEPENLTFLTRAIHWSTISGMFPKALELTHTFTQRGGQMSSLIDAKLISESLIKLGIPEDEFSETQKLAFELLREHKISHEGTRAEIGYCQEDQSIYFEISVATDSKTAVDLECALAIRLNDSLPEWHADKLILGFVPK